MTVTLDAKSPEGPIADKWANYKEDAKLVNPANKRKYKILVVGSGLAGAAAAATLGELGYRFQFITLAGFHSLNAAMFELARDYAAGGMPAYVELQEREFELEEDGYTATRHQREVGAGYFDRVAEIVSGGESSTLALRGSTEEAQFDSAAA